MSYVATLCPDNNVQVTVPAWRTNNPTSGIDFTNPRLGQESNPQPYTRCPDDPFHGVSVITIGLKLLYFFPILR